MSVGNVTDEGLPASAARYFIIVMEYCPAGDLKARTAGL